MKAVLVSCFDYYENRIKFIENYLLKKGFEITIICSDFDHIEKTKKKYRQANYTMVDTIPYYKNLSLKRIYSHYNFTKKVLEKVEQLKPDLLWVMIPPNYLTKELGNYRKKANTLLIYDLIDMWPETIPIKESTLYKIPFQFWKNLRDNFLNKADLIITECSLYQEQLKYIVSKEKMKTLYLAKETNKNAIRKKTLKSKICICYLGSINNIIDIELIVKLLQEIKKYKNVVLHIIGDGENKQALLEALLEADIEVEDHGKIFNEIKKIKIFNQCHFGLNIMKRDVYVGLTMKSIDYFCAGLPVISNIPADTESLVDKYSAGFNVTKNSLKKVTKEIVKMNEDNYLKMTKQTQKMYNENFSSEAFNKKFKTILKDLHIEV